MKTRQLVGNDPSFIKIVSENFVAVAANDVDYSNAPDGQKKKLEYKWLADALKDSNGIQQGIYAVTPSGRFLSRVDGGWPVYDPAISGVKLHYSLEEYRAMDPDERRDCPIFPPAERMDFEWRKFAPPKDALDMTVINRSLPYEGADKFDMRHPMYFKTDRLILSRKDQLAMLPDEFTENATFEVNKEIRDRFLLHDHLAMGCDAWWSEHIKSSEMTATVTSVNNGEATIEYAASWKAKGNSKWCKSSYAGSMLGKARVDISSRTFTSLEFVALGEHDVGEMRDNLHRNVSTTPVGMVAAITPEFLQNQPPPMKWADGYPKSWRK